MGELAATGAHFEAWCGVYGDLIGTWVDVIYGFDKEWLKIIGSHGAKVSSYAKIATEEKLKKNGWL